jgi:hypothetical protein
MTSNPTCYDMARALGVALRVPPVRIRVLPYLPEGFVIEFSSPTCRNRILSWSWFLPVGGLLYRFLPWTPTSHAEVSDLCYKVRLCIEGVPAHSHQLASVAQLMAPATLMEKIEVDPFADKDRACCVVWAWTQDPNGFAKSGTLQLENAPGRMESYWIHDGRGRLLTRRERHGPIGMLSYLVLIHLDQIIDYKVYRPPSSGNTYSGSWCSSAISIPGETGDVWPRTFTFD